MKFSENWLREFVDPDIDTDRLMEQLTMAGLEVEGVESCRPDFSGVIVGRVSRVEPHPDADALSLCRVDDGSGGELRIVCGASNVRAGGCYPLAPVGAVLPGGRRIENTAVRGEDSEGMLCSPAELGLSDDADGLMELGDDASVGRDLAVFLDLDDDVIEIALTPNRGDCLSLLGIAREVAVLNGMSLNRRSVTPVSNTIDDRRGVQLQAVAACPRYSGRLLRGVDAGRPTPAWISERLRRCGIRSINVIVDISNYVMLEMGQPMHAFDNDRLSGDIHVRFAGRDETLVTLDGEKRELDADTLVIADEAGPVAMAGIMGGEASAVDESSRDIFLESAWFAPQVLMGQARRYGMQTDASYRFERGVDGTLQGRAIERATELIMKICGGKPGPLCDISDAAHLPRPGLVEFRVAEVERRLGIRISPGRCREILDRLGFAIDGKQETLWRVKVPSHRFDIGIEADLIEEVARIHGYGAIPSRLPRAELRMPETQGGADAAMVRQLVGRGYHEVITYSFVDPALQQRLLGEGGALELLNPISTELSVMRRSLWPGLLQALVYNLKRQHQRVRLFERGRIYRAPEGAGQIPMLGGIIYGKILPEQWATETSYCDFFDLKGDVEAMLGQACGPGRKLRFQAVTHAALQDGQAAEVLLDNQVVGMLGAVAPQHCRALDLLHPAYVFEVELPRIPSKEGIKYAKLSKYPSIRRDLSLLVDEDLPVAELLEGIRNQAGQDLRNLELFDLYRGEGVDLGKKSLALGLTFQRSSSTLTDTEVDVLIARLLESLQDTYGATLRE
ncbi:MAG: phenylalanine--tRNA ligase subunit beta [Gammaproteobacteria bacterium]